MFSLFAVDVLVEYLNTPILGYAEQLTRSFFGLLVFFRAWLYTLTRLSLGLGAGLDKKALAKDAADNLSRACALCFFAFALQWLHSPESPLLNGYFAVGPYVFARQRFVILVGLFILNNSRQYRVESNRHLLEYALVLALAVLFRLLLVCATNLISAFFSLVGFSLNLYVLILFEASRAEAREAGVKYYYLSTFSSGLRVYGILLLFALVQTGHYGKVCQVLATHEDDLQHNLPLLRFAVRLLLTGVFFKLSAFPGHLWAPDVYEGSPDPIAAFFRLPVKIVVLSFLVSLLSIALDPIYAVWQPYLIVSSVGSLVWGCFGALFEKSTKRFRAYASINQIGFLLLGLATNCEGGTRAALVYLALYAIINIGFLGVFLAARQFRGCGLLYLTDFRGLGQRNWGWSWSLSRRLLSMAGIPPLAGFFGKYYLLLHAQEQGLIGLVVVALITSLVSTYYYLRVIKTRWFEGTDGITSVVCCLSRTNAVRVYLAEAFLWSFVRFSGLFVDAFDVFSLALTA